METRRSSERAEKRRNIGHCRRRAARVRQNDDLDLEREARDQPGEVSTDATERVVLQPASIDRDPDATVWLHAAAYSASSAGAMAASQS